MSIVVWRSSSRMFGEDDEPVSGEEEEEEEKEEEGEGKGEGEGEDEGENVTIALEVIETVDGVGKLELWLETTPLSSVFVKTPDVPVSVELAAMVREPCEDMTRVVQYAEVQGRLALHWQLHNKGQLRRLDDFAAGRWEGKA